MRTKELSAPVAMFKLAAALERYDMRVRALAGRSLDLEIVRRVQHDFGELRLLCASLPKLSVSWTAVLLSRAKLLQALCQRAGPAAAALLHEHLAEVEGLRRRCLRAIGAQGLALT
ncbi:hypothetical protein H8N03_00205 [Ramlibacter sp. USB13]|uniref:Uncharacterized protein n=1 Tax=Ramlibacter cellulosilyticus TaxID=2764187 RepID=A0A923MLH5_9BURK|nr:hypothetical protein [Ramlibacter cellulosilyticus]MBC5781343.1 hypothetical protein [Ramlibacter cellulosilyticus]